MSNRPPQSVESAHADIDRLIALFNSGRFDELETCAREFIAHEPESGLAWKALGIALKMQGKEALPVLRNAAKFLPDDAEAQRNLGVALADLGQLEEAVASFRCALSIRPDYAEAHDNLGNALKDLGQPEAAAASLRRALHIKPAYAEAHNDLGNGLLDLGQLDAAAQCYRHALQLNSRLFQAHRNLGNVLRELGRLDAAVDSYRRALEIKPDYAEAHSDLGNALESQGRTAEAEACIRRALEIRPDFATAMIFMAELQCDTGKFAEAEESLQRAIGLEPENPEAWAGITRCRKMTPADSAWLATALRLAAKGLPVRKASTLEFAIGKYFDDVGDFEQAYFHFRRGNELSKRFAPKYDRQPVTQAVELVTSLFDKEWLHRERHNANQSARPVFVVGMPRSGTSLAEQILASHPAIYGAGELDFWPSSFTKDGIYAVAGASGSHALRKLADDYLKLLTRDSGDALYVVDKTPVNFMALGLIRAAFPNARIIHMQRNPLDTCLSIYFQRFRSAHAYANDLADIAHYYGEYRRIMRHWQDTFPQDAILHVPYEGLTDDLEGWSRKMLEFAGVPWDERCLNFHLTERKVGTASNWQVRQKIHKTSVARWRNYEKYLGPLASLAT